MTLNDPCHGLLGVWLAIVWRTKHWQGGTVNAVVRILLHLLLLWRAVGKFVQDFPALSLVERLFFTYTRHSPAVGCIGRTAQGNLILNGRTIHKPSDRPNIGPAACRVIKNRGVLGFSVK